MKIEGTAFSMGDTVTLVDFPEEKYKVVAVAVYADSETSETFVCLEDAKEWYKLVGTSTVQPCGG